MAACGSSDESGAEQLAHQRELAAARHQAAQDARQSAHIKELEDQLEQRDPNAARQGSQTPSAEAGSETEASSGDWPGPSAYTAILASDASEAQARADQANASAAGLDAGVLDSSDFSSLRPGYWVLFSGSFSTVSEAISRVSRAHELGYSDAYPRFVSR
jgi:hypothetical protein